MDGDPLPIILLMLGFVVANAFFIAAEFAMVKVRGSRVEALAEEGRPGARLAMRISGNLDVYMLVCQLGISLATLALGILVAPMLSAAISPLLTDLGWPQAAVELVSFLIVISVLAFVHIVLGKLVPKMLAIHHAERFTLMTAAPLVLFHYVMYPFVYILNGTGQWLLRRFGVDMAEARDAAHTEEEILLLVKESHRSGLIDNTELTLVDNIFEFTETTAREIMIPRTDMVCLYADLDFEENRKIAMLEMHTRFPVADKDKDNIIGFVHIKDMLKVADRKQVEIAQLMRPITTVPETMQISTLLKMMQKKKTQIAILIDEYGGTAGLVTLEDIMEELVGEIQDEFDEERPDIEKLDEQTYSVNAAMLIEEVNSFFGTEISSDDYDTIGGWMYAQVTIPPMKNQTVRYADHFEFVIDETDHMRISRLLVRKYVQSNVIEMPQFVS